MKVNVKNNDIEGAIRALKRKIQADGMMKELRQRAYFEKPTTKRRRKKAQAIKRTERTERKRLQDEGF